jgi:hypothetical protein
MSNHHFFKVSIADFNTTLLFSFELIKQNFNQQNEAKNDPVSMELMLFIDLDRKLFFFTDASNMQLSEEIIEDRYNCEVVETNLNQIKSWRKKPASQAKA